MEYLEVRIAANAVTKELAELEVRACLYFFEKGKTAILLDAISESEARQFSSVPPDLLEREKQLRLDLAGYEAKLATAIEDGVDSLKTATWRSRRLTANEGYWSLIETLEQEYPDYYDLKYNNTIASVESVQTYLQTDSTQF